MYLNKTEYETYSGKTAPADFDRLEYKAAKKLQALTHSRIDAMEVIPEAVKRCMVEIMDIVSNAAKVQSGSTGAITGFSNDGYSESYGKALTPEYYDGVIFDVASDYLSEELDDTGVPLMFLGV